MQCPKCKWMMHEEDDVSIFGGKYWICNNPECGYMRAIVKLLPTYEELLEENKKLKKTIEQMNQEIAGNAPQSAQD